MTPETVWILLAIAVIALGAGFVHSAIGFGFGIVAIALLPLVIDVRSSHVMLSLASVPMISMAAWTYREGIDWKSLRPALIGAAILMPLGIYLFGVVSLDLLIRATGVAIIAMVAMSFYNRYRKVESETQTGATSSFLAGAAGGFLAGAVSIAGPPIAAYALRQGWPPEKFKAFVTQCLLVISIYKVIGLALGRLITVEAGLEAIWATPFSMLGVHLGALASKRINPARFQWLVATALILVALKMLCF